MNSEGHIEDQQGVLPIEFAEHFEPTLEQNGFEKLNLETNAKFDIFDSLNPERDFIFTAKYHEQNLKLKIFQYFHENMVKPEPVSDQTEKARDKEWEKSLNNIALQIDTLVNEMVLYAGTGSALVTIHGYKNPETSCIKNIRSFLSILGCLSWSPAEDFATSRFHTDGFKESPIQYNDRFIVTLAGPSTIFCTLHKEYREDFNNLQELYREYNILNTRDHLDGKILVRQNIDKYLNEHEGKFETHPRGTIIHFLSGPDKGAIHSEPHISGPRIVLKVTVGTKTEIDCFDISCVKHNRVTILHEEPKQPDNQSPPADILRFDQVLEVMKDFKKGEELAPKNYDLPPLRHNCNLD
jgi:hypothetical protein